MYVEQFIYGKNLLPYSNFEVLNLTQYLVTALLYSRVRYKLVRDELKSKPDYSQSEISQRKHYSLLAYAIVATVATVS